MKKSMPQISRIFTYPINLVKAHRSFFKMRKQTALNVVTEIKHIVDQDALKETDNIISFLQPKIYRKIYKFVKRASKKPFVIGVAGGSASGKTFTTDLFIKNANQILSKTPYKPYVSSLALDNFMYNMSKTVRQLGSSEKFFATYNFDRPNAIEFNLLTKKLKQLLKGHNVLVPKTLFNSYAERVDNVIPILSAPLLVIEGLLPFSNRGVRKKLNLKIFIATPQNIMEERWWQRASTRNFFKNKQGYTFLNKVFSSYYKRVELPGRKHADVIFNGVASPEAINNFFIQLIQRVHATIKEGQKSMKRIQN